MNTPTTYPSRAEFEADRKRREAITNPPTKTAPLDAIKPRRGGILVAGVRRESGEIVPVWPSKPPKGWIDATEARDLCEGGIAEPATPEEINAWLEANEGRDA